MSTTKLRVDRRGFCKAAAGAVLALPNVVPSSSLGKDGAVAANNRIGVGSIGVGNRGYQMLGGFLNQPDAQIVAVCDVNARRRAAAEQRVNAHYQTTGCRRHHDYRELLSRVDVDVVIIATPDHWHVLMALAAAQAGRDIFLEKPIGVTVAEARALRAAVKRHATVFQFGTQQRSDGKFRLACELVRNGRIGRLQEVNVWSPGSNAGGSLERAPVPEWLDYEMWVGPAPMSPYTKHRCTNRFEPGDPFKVWPFISDYCTGWIAGWGIHPLDIALWGADDLLSGPFTIEGTGSFPAQGLCDTATDWDLTLKFEAGGVLNFSGPVSAGKWKGRFARHREFGTVFVGTEGWIHVDRSSISAEPASTLQSSIGPGEIHLAKSDNHARNLLDCVKTRGRPVSHIDSAYTVDTICQVSAIAARLGRLLQWDPNEQRFADDDTANRLLSRAMRSPWHL
jgi:predicted dehydrogenase